MDLLCVLAVWFTNIMILIVLIYNLIKDNKNNQAKTELNQLRFNFNYEPKETDFQIIETLIQENLAEYRITKLEHVEKLYITEEIQNKIFEYVLRKVLYQISPIYLQRLSYIYNKDRLDEIISQKINMYILEYTISVNSNVIGGNSNN